MHGVYMPTSSVTSPPIRHIVHADLDTFFVSVERLLDPSLEGKPVIVGGDRDARGVVSACSYETREFGVRSGMPLRTAARLCPHARFLPVRLSVYREHSLQVTRFIRDAVPVVERASIDEFYFDLTGCERLFGDLPTWCEEFAGKVLTETGLPITLGLASNKLMAKMATNHAKSQTALASRGWRTHVIRHGAEASFLAPLPVRSLPGIGPRTADKLIGLGFETLGHIQRAPEKHLEQVFGENGISMYRRAHGIDDRIVTPVHEPKSIGHETTFREDVTDREQIYKTLRRLAEKTASNLRSRERSATRVVLKWRYSDFETITRSVTISPTDEASSLYGAVLPAARRLFVRGRAVRLVGVRAEGLTGAAHQTSLLEQAPERRRSLLKAIDELRSRYGDDIIEPGSLK